MEKKRKVNKLDAIVGVCLMNVIGILIDFFTGYRNYVNWGFAIFWILFILCIIKFTNKTPLTNFGDNFHYIGSLLISDWVLGSLLIIHMHPWGLNDIYTVPVETVENFNNWFAFFIGIILIIKYVINQYIKGKKKTI